MSNVAEVPALEERQPGRWRHYTAEQKRALLDECTRPGGSISVVARRYGVAPSLLFNWKRVMDDATKKDPKANERVVPESEVKQPRGRNPVNDRLLNARFPRASRYHPDWVMEGAFGGNPLWLAEWLSEKVALREGMRVLDLGCGRAKSSVFLAREFGVQVWATDLWISADENLVRLRHAGIEDRPFRCMRTPGICRSLPSSSTRSCRSIRSSTTARMIST